MLQILVAVKNIYISLQLVYVSSNLSTRRVLAELLRKLFTPPDMISHLRRIP